MAVFTTLFVCLTIALSVEGAPNAASISGGTPVQVQLRKVPKRSADQPEAVSLKIDGQGHNYELNLRPTTTSIFSPNFQYRLSMRDSNDQPILVPKTPKVAKLQEIENRIFIDAETDSVLLLKDETVEGIVYGNKAIIPSASGHFIKTHTYERNGQSVEDSVVILNQTVQVKTSDRKRQAGPMAVELMVYTDYDWVQLFSGDQNRMTEYLAVFFHSVNNRYARAFPNGEMSVQIVLAGITPITSRSNQPFIENNRQYGVDGDIAFSRVLKAFGEYVPKGGYDLVTLMVGSGSHKAPVGGTQGIAYRGGVCDIGRMYSTGLFSTGVNVDLDRNMDYEGVHSVIHEIGHNLGAKHDGMTGAQGKDSNWDCPSTDGYMMGYSQDGGPHHYRFSSCSIKDMLNKVSTVTCLSTTDAQAPIRLSPEWDGNKESFDDICKAAYNDPSSTARPQNPDDMCKVLWCSTPGGFYEGMGFTIPDCIPCGGQGGHCWESSCQVGAAQCQ